MLLYQKLHTIQTKIKGLGKDSKSFQYGYVSGAKVLEFVRPLMDEYGLLLKQEIISIENDRQDYTTIGKRWEEVDGKNKQVEFDKPKSEILSKVMMKFTWIDIETGDKDENSFGANGQNDWEKGLGSALTYAERYFLLKYFHIPTDEDDIDNDLRKKVDDDKNKETPEAKPVQTPAQQTTPPANQKPAKVIIETEALKKEIDAFTNIDEFVDCRTKYGLTPEQKTIVTKKFNELFPNHKK